MVAPLIAMGSRSPSAALSPLPRLYGDSPFSLWAARGPLYPLSAISMVAPLSSMGRVWAALSPLPHLYGSSIDPYGDSLPHGQILGFPVALWGGAQTHCGPPPLCPPTLPVPHTHHEDDGHPLDVTEGTHGHGHSHQGGIGGG